MTQEMLLEEKMLQEKIWAVIGANQNPRKYGNMIYQKLKRRGYTTYAVNPHFAEVDGDTCYPSLAALPRKPDVINLVVAPEQTKKYVQEAAQLGISNLWLQPGTYDDEVLALIDDLSLTAVQACVLVATR